MTDTERWVSGACERIMASGRVRLYRDLYKDLRERHQCRVACRLIEAGLRRTRFVRWPRYGHPSPRTTVARARAIAALKRLARWAGRRDVGQLAEVYDVV